MQHLTILRLCIKRDWGQVENGLDFALFSISERVEQTGQGVYF